MIRKLIPFMGKYKKYALLTPLCVILEVALEIFIPLLMAKIIDVGIAEGNMPYVVKTGLTMVLMAMVSLVFGALAGRFAALAAMGFARELRQALFDKVQEFSFANIDRFSTASLITRLTTDVTNTQNIIMMIIRILVRAPLMLVCAACMAVYINARLALVFLVAAPVLGVGLFFIMKNAFPRFQKMMGKYDEMNSSIQENLIAIRVVKAYVRSDHENEKFRNAADQLRVAQKRAEKLVVTAMPLLMFIMYGCMVAICWFGGNFIIAGDMLTGELMSFISYATQILMSLMMVAMFFVSLVLSKASVGRIVEVLEEEVDIQDNTPSLELEDGAAANRGVRDGSVVFDNVSFSYSKDEEHLALKDIRLTIQSGETVGIIGGTGSAKTTLVQLIPRLYDVFSGKVLVGGKDVRDYPLEELRNAVAMVLQKNVLFSGTIEENLKWGNPRATHQQVVEACKAAAAHDFIMSFPDGYQTDLGQGGVNVSGGQKQRLCIARALLKNPRIIILDDSTSAVDTATDSEIREAFRTRLTDTTTIIIAQRISSVAEADKIVVMDDGRIEAVGTHEELLKTSEIYRDVFESQQKGVA